MTSLKKNTVLLFLLSFSYLSYSQSNKITIKTSFGLSDISCNQDTILKRNIDIQIFYNGSYISVKKFEATKCQNIYVLNKFKGKFKALITADQYLPSEIDFEINDITKDTLFLKTTIFKTGISKKLDEVTVKNTISPIKMEGNKTTYSIQNNDALNNGSVLESIKKLPGVMIDMNGNVSLKSKTVTIYIDGLPASISGQDLNNYLGSISSSSVSKIEIINNPGAAYDANTTADVINIVTKSKNQKGVSGNLYSGTTVYKMNKHENSMSLNGLYQKLNWNTNVSYNDVTSQNSIDKQITDKQNGNTIVDFNNNETNQKPINIRLGAGYPIGNVNIDMKYSYSRMDQKTILNSEFNSNENYLLTSQNSNGFQDFNSRRNEFTTALNYKIKNSDKLVKLNYQLIDYDKNTDASNQSILNSNPYENHNENQFNSRINKIKADIVYPLEKIKISSGLKYSISDVASNGNYQNTLNNNSNTILFNYNDYSMAGYTEAYKSINKFDITLGLRYEYLKMNSQSNASTILSKNYSNFFPSFNISYHLGSATDINFSYSKKAKLPTYQELDPNSGGIINSLVSDTGNPLLQPSFYHNSELKFTFNKFLNLSFSYSKAKTDNFLVFNKNNGTYQQTTEQFENIKNFNSTIGIPVPLGIFTKGIKYLNTITDINEINYLYIYGGINSFTYDQLNFKNSFSILKYLSVYTQFLTPFKTKTNFQYTYSSNGNFQIYNVQKSFHKLDLTLTKSLFNNSAKIQFSYADILNSANKIYALYTNNNILADVILKNDSQKIKFSITYNFGSFKQTAEKKEENEDRDTKKNTLDIKI